MKRVPIVIILTALVTGLFLSLTTCETPTIKKPDKVVIESSVKAIGNIDEGFQSAKEALQVRADSLQKALDVSTGRLAITKRKLAESQEKLLAFARDTVAESCDSLREQAIRFSAIVDSTQEQYECKIADLQDLLATKQSEVYLCNTAYNSMKSISEANLERERQLTKDLQTAYKAQRRKNVQNKLLAGGLVLLSGITTTLYINTTHK